MCNININNNKILVRLGYIQNNNNFSFKHNKSSNNNIYNKINESSNTIITFKLIFSIICFYILFRF